MRTIARLTFIAAILFAMAQVTPAQQSTREIGLFDWRPGPDLSRPLNSPNAKKLPLIKVKGNRFVNEHGDTVLFRGLAIADPDKGENILRVITPAELTKQRTQHRYALGRRPKVRDTLRVA